MPTDNIRILYLSQHSSDHRPFEALISRRKLNYEVSVALNARQTAALVESGSPHIVIIDYDLEAQVDLNELELPNEAARIVLVAPGNERTAVSALRDGAYAYLIKDLESHYLEALPLLMAQALQSKLDFSQHKRTEETLRRSQERFEQFVSSISDHIYVTEFKPGGCITNHYISPNVEDLTGYGATVFINDWFQWSTLVIHPDDRELAARQAAQLSQGQSSKAEYRLIRANGQVIWVRDSAQVKASGSSFIVYGVVSDITEYKQLEEALRAERASLAERVQDRTAALTTANIELAHALKAKDEFLATMSHELRTPLSAILGMAEILEEQIYGDLTQKQLGYVQTIGKSGRHLLNLINDMLDISKIQVNKLELDLRDVPVSTICTKSLHFIKQAAHQKQIEVRLDVEDPVNSIWADERRVVQILANLLTNAVKFTPEAGSIGLEVRGDHEHQLLQFTVWDTGIGIAQRDLQRLFKPFVQIDASLARVHEGTGLGLALVYHLTKLHGGSIAVESEVNVGSRFTVTLPWRPANLSEPANNLPIDASPQSDLKPNPVLAGPALATILFAEDNQANAEVVASYLTAKGYRLIIAKNGTEVIEQSKQERPDLILMDIQMPEVSGLEAIRRLRADQSLSDIPIIAVTALAMPDDRQRCLEAGANEYLSKPVSFKELSRTIKQLLAKAPVLS